MDSDFFSSLDQLLDTELHIVGSRGQEQLYAAHLFHGVNLSLTEYSDNAAMEAVGKLCKSLGQKFDSELDAWVRERNSFVWVRRNNHTELSLHEGIYDPDGMPVRRLREPTALKVYQRLQETYIQ
jgi:hypothetical protein